MGQSFKDEEQEAREKYYQIEKNLNWFWVKGWIGSDTKQKMIACLPERIRYL